MEELDNSWAFLAAQAYRPRTEADYLQDFKQDYDHYSHAVDVAASAKGASSKGVTLSSNGPIPGANAQSYLPAVSNDAQYVIPNLPSAGPKQSLISKVGMSILDYLIKPTEACTPAALMAMQQAAMMTTPVPFVTWNQQMGLEGDQSTSFPMPPDYLGGLSKYFGGNADDMSSGLDPYTFPASQSRAWKTDTLVDQPGVALDKVSFPKLELGLTLPYFLFKKNGGATGGNSGQTKMYDHDYDKHKPKASGQGARWEGASVNPIPDSNTGQQLLDTAYAKNKNNKELFNYYDNKVIVFKSSNDGRWHAYEVEKNVLKATGPDVLKLFLDDGLINHSDYKKLLKK